MSSCLGLYINDNIVKYAKMTMDNNKNITLENYGVRYIKESLNNLLNNIVDETNSSKDLIAINSQKGIFVNYTMFDQVNTKNFAGNVAKMEFESWCEKNGKIPSNYSYVYKAADAVNLENKLNVALNIMEKDIINKYNDIGNIKLSDMYPVEFLMNRLVPQGENNYILVNLDDRLSIFVISQGKIVDFKFYDFGVNNIIDKFSEVLGSYQKAYEACKQLNVYSDEETNNDKKLEEIAEPILQEILKSVAVMANRYKNDIDKVIICGQGIVFTNIDILFKEYLNLKCDILKPDFLKTISNFRNIAEALETTPAMALALETLNPKETNLNHIKGGNKLKNKFDRLITKEKKSSNNRSNESKLFRKNIGINLSNNKLLTYTTCFGIICALAIVAYSTFFILYSNSADKTLNKIETSINEIQDKKTKISSDISYVNSNTNEYKKINDKVEEIVEEMEKDSTSRYTTYNVAAFLQNIIKIIPKNVQLKTITSDDNKNVVIRAQSDSYADLGYFISELKLSGTLNKIEIIKVENDTISTVEIGGELP